MKNTNASFPSHNPHSMLLKTPVLHIPLVFDEKCRCEGHFPCATHFLEDGSGNVTCFPPIFTTLFSFPRVREKSVLQGWWTCWIWATGSPIWSPWRLLIVCFLTEITPAPFPGASKPLSSSPAYLQCREMKFRSRVGSPWLSYWSQIQSCLKKAKVSRTQHRSRSAGFAAWPVDSLEVFSYIPGLQIFLRFFTPPPLHPLKLGPQEYFKGNSIHMCLIRVHLTHWHVVFQELIDVQGVSWPLFLSLAALPFFELENCLLLGVSSAFESWKFGAQLDLQFSNLRGIRGLTNVASIYKTLSCLISSSFFFFMCDTSS